MAMWLPLHRRISSPLKRKRRVMESSPTAGLGSAFRSTPLSTPLQHVDIAVSAVGEGTHSVRSTMAGHSSIQGWRSNMEDKYIIEDLTSMPKHSLVAVFDGHAGVECAAFCSNNLVSILQQTAAWKLYKALHSTAANKPGNNGKNKHKKSTSDADLTEERNKLLSQALVEAYLKLDLEFLRSIVPRSAVEKGYADSQNIDEFAVHVDDTVIERIQEAMTGGGCTAVCALITPDSVVVANCGDSRCVISSTAPVATGEPVTVSTSGKNSKKNPSASCEKSYSYTSVAMTDDHKPSNPEERERVDAAGGQVIMDRVDGSLAMSRAIGDFRYKLDPRYDLTQQKVIAIPDISIYERKKIEVDGCPVDDILILACDGVFDVMDNVTMVENIRGIVENMELVSEKADVVAGTKSTPGLVRYSDVARILISSCLALQSTDNISVCIVPLNPC